MSRPNAQDVDFLATVRREGRDLTVECERSVLGCDSTPASPHLGTYGTLVLLRDIVGKMERNTLMLNVNLLHLLRPSRLKDS